MAYSSLCSVSLTEELPALLTIWCACYLANFQIIECIQVLQCTYAYGYYLDDKGPQDDADEHACCRCMPGSLNL
uniref:Uncharacterized protein n=1 Tax=Triticum urartu TaxID=4572 RepID=A0A8R7THH6_TRIUA